MTTKKITVDDLKPIFIGINEDGFAGYEIPFFGIGFSSEEEKQKFVDKVNNDNLKYSAEKLPWAK